MKRSQPPTDVAEASKRRAKSPVAGSGGTRPGLSFTGFGEVGPSLDVTRSRDFAQILGKISSYHPNEDCNGQEICYGSLLDMAVQVREDPLAYKKNSTQDVQDGFAHVTLTFSGNYYWTSLCDTVDFGCTNRKTSQIFRRLTALPGVEIEGIVSWTNLEGARAEWKKAGRSVTLLVDINVYGPSNSAIAKSAGKLLGDARLFLQLPSFNARSGGYENPQYLKLPNVAHIQITETPGTSAVITTPEREKDVSRFELESILDSIPQSKVLREVATSWRIRTPLMKYQREAVDFLTRRETGDLPPSLNLWKPCFPPGGCFFYKHVITGAKSSDIDDALGGILADDMGLGKTLSILTVIVGSLERALDYAIKLTRSSIDSWRDMTPCKATLVIVPSSLLLESWEEEITKHLEPETLRVHLYHGSGKHIDLPDLLRTDVVLTTYATVAADFCRGNSTLNHISWYRLVLDEAHYIRNPARKQFRAIQTIPAHIRWCLTGTPIQNSLEDLGALVKFLQIPVLDDLASFHKHISTPILSNVNGRFSNLSRLLEAICLRRTKALLEQRQPLVEIIALQFSTEERTRYRDYADGCKHAIDLAVSGHSFKKANQQVIQAILGLRLFCNDGEKALVKRNAAYGIPVLPEEALSFLQTSSDAVCIQCGCEITTIYQGGDKSSGILTICQHLFCGECLPGFEADLNDNIEDGYSRCPLCGLKAKRSSFVVLPSDEEDSLHVQNIAHPTKLRAILEKVQLQGMSDKCIIFSSWKTTLDIMANMLDTVALPYFRIHGSISASKRSSILAEFEHSTTTRVLLITLGTGAVGLNKMKAANIVHIIEPQWNPSVENQAIGRVTRLGQEKDVQIFRYVMEGSVEQAIQSRQLRKLQLARGGFGLTKEDHSGERLNEIMSLICPSFLSDKVVDVVSPTLRSQESPSKARSDLEYYISS